MLSYYLHGVKKAFGVVKKIALVLIVLFLVLNFSIYFIKKDQPKVAPDTLLTENRTEIYKIVNNKKLNSTTEGKLQVTAMRMFSCALIGEACTNNPKDADKNFNRSVFGGISKLLVSPFEHPPASGLAWVYSGLQKSGFVPQTYAAAGIGFASLSPLITIWTALRNLSYLVLALVIIVIGFMIMFRAKINPQTTISIENALPKIVIALLLITFSFPIAGFLIDLMYVVIAIILSVIGQPLTSAALGGAPGPRNITEIQNYYMAAGPWQLLENLVSPTRRFGIVDTLFDLPNSLLDVIPQVGGVIRYLSLFLGVFALFPWLHNNFVHPFLGALAAPLPDDANLSAVIATIGWDIQASSVKVGNVILIPIVLGISALLGAYLIVPLVIGLIIFLTILLIFFRIFFLLIGAYIKLLVYVSISPIYLMLEAVPGQSTFINWIKILLGQLAVFPVVIALLQIAAIIIRSADNGNLIQLPFMFGIEGRSFGFILGMVFMFMIPDFVKVVQQVFIPKPGPLDGVGPGIFFGGATTGLSTGLGEVSKYAGFGYYVPRLGKLIETASGGLVKMPSGGGHPQHT